MYLDARPLLGRVGVRCAFCHDAFGPLDAPADCSSCLTLLHAGCWREAGRCPSLGCQGPARGGARTVALQAAVALHALAVAPWALVALFLGAQGDRFVLAGVAVLAAALSLSYAGRRRADAVWLLLLSGCGLVVTVFAFVQSQKVFLTFD